MLLLTDEWFFYRNFLFSGLVTSWAVEVLFSWKTSQFLVFHTVFWSLSDIFLFSIAQVSFYELLKLVHFY